MKHIPFKIILSCNLGTFLEFFDYTLYGYFASTIGRLFFPIESHQLQLIAAWAIFSVGFLIRPIGALLFGWFADQYGRKNILTLSIALMALPTTLIGLLPTFDQIGWGAPLLLLLFRLIQGVAISAEYNGLSIYTLENNWNHPGLLGAFTPFSCGMGMLVASVVAYLFTNSSIDMVWQWRIPFILAGTLVGCIACYLRKMMQETQGFIALQETHQVVQNPLRLIIKQNKLAFLTNIITSAYMCSASYLLLVYMSTYLYQQFSVALTTALLFTSIASFVEAISTLLFGWISDYVGRWQILFIASLLMVCTSIIFMIFHLTLIQLMWMLLVLVILLGAFDGPLTMYLPELFKTNIRYSGTAFGYNVGGAAIGGLAPFIMSMLLQLIPEPRLLLGAYLGLFALLACCLIGIHTLSILKVKKSNTGERLYAEVGF